MSIDHSRRGFFVKLASLAGVAAVAPGLFGLLSQASAQERRRGGPAAGKSEADLPLVNPKDGPAAAVNYTEDHKTVTKPELKADRQGVKFEQQHCANCGFYKNVGKKDGKDVGTCTIFPGKVVHGTAWCGSWNKKA